MKRACVHPHCVLLFDVVDDLSCAHIIMELLRGGTVQERMAQDSTFSEGQCSRITSHVVSVGGRVRDNLCEYISIIKQRYIT